MTGLVDALLIAAVAALVIVRQFRASRIGAGERWWLAPAVLTVVALREPALIDAHHRTESVLLLGAELLIGVATGAAWAWTTRIWAEPDGTVWSKGTRASAVVWGAGDSPAHRALRPRCGIGREAGHVRPAPRSGDHVARPWRDPHLACSILASDPRAEPGIR